MPDRAGGPLLVSDGLFGKQKVAKLSVERRIAAPDPLQDHRCVLFLFVAIVREYRLELVVFTGIDALVVPVDGFKLFHQRRDRTVHVARLVSQLFNCFVVSLICHRSLLVK